MILIDIDLPKADDDFVELVIFGDGRVLQTGESWRNLSDGKTYYTTTTPEKHFLAEQVPQNGRMIDADKLTPIEIMEGIEETKAVWWSDIETAPTIDAKPVVNGKWEDNHTTCSVCGWQMIDDVTESRMMLGFKFCPNCGADMRGGKDA